MGQCLHEEIEEISTLLAGSTRVSRRVTRQGGLTRLDYRFHVNAYKHLTAKGLPAAVIQPGLKSNPGSCKEALSRRSWGRGKVEFLSSQVQYTFCPLHLRPDEADNLPNWSSMALSRVLKLSLQTKLWHHTGSWTEETVLSDEVKDVET